MDTTKILTHMAMAEATGASGDKKKAIVLNVLIGSGVITSESEKLAASLVIDALAWAANNPGELRNMLEQGRTTCVTCFGCRRST
jgi:hypothetical protein